MAYYKYDGSLAAETPASTSSQFGSYAGGDTLIGLSGPDLLCANGPNSLLIGNGGGDTFVIQADNVQIQEVVGGANKISAYTNIDLNDYPNIDNVEVGGERYYAAGNAHDNVVQASGQYINLYGGAGQDVLVGSGQHTTFIVVKGEGNDAIYNFNTAADTVRLSAGFTSFAQVQQHLAQVGGDVKLDMGDGDGLVFRNLSVDQLTAANFQVGLDPAKLGAQTFDDDFNSFKVWNGNSGTWATTFWYDDPKGNGGTLGGNGEAQWYINANYGPTASVTPWIASEGVLTITAAPASASISPLINNYQYTSGEINTAQSFAQTYGYFEMRADLPDNVGGWPAFWLVPEDGSWPPELDVMETLTKDPNVDWTTSHSSIGGNTQSQAASFIPDTADGFHTYGVLWTKSDLVWYVDGVEVFHTATPADMNKPMYMIANLALGGWGGPVDPTQLPAQLKIDYIRAYALADGSSSVTLNTVTPDTSAGSPGGATSPSLAAPTGLADTAVVGGYVNAAHNLASQTLTGAAAPGAAVTVYDGSTVLGVASADATTGQWAFTLGKLVDSAHALSATASAGGLTSAQSAALSFTVDTVAPRVAVGDVVYDAATRTTTLCGVSEAGASVKVLDKSAVVGTATADSSGAWSLTARLGAGTHQFTEQATDAAGNTGASAGVAIFDRSGSAKLAGGSGDDVLIGNGGDTLTGGAGHDTFVFNAKFGLNTVTDFKPQDDVVAVDHTLFSSFTSLMQHAVQSGASTVITYDAGNVITLQNTSLSSLSAGNFAFV